MTYRMQCDTDGWSRDHDTEAEAERQARQHAWSQLHHTSVWVDGRRVRTVTPHEALGLPAKPARRRHA
jgi:hypothetical protein